MVGSYKRELVGGEVTKWHKYNSLFLFFSPLEAAVWEYLPGNNRQNCEPLLPVYSVSSSLYEPTGPNHLHFLPSLTPSPSTVTSHTVNPMNGQYWPSQGPSGQPWLQLGLPALPLGLSERWRDLLHSGGPHRCGGSFRPSHLSYCF